MITRYHSKNGLQDKLVLMALDAQRNIDMRMIQLSSHVLEHIKSPDIAHLYDKNILMECIRRVKEHPSEPLNIEVEILPSGVKLLKSYLVRVKYDEDCSLFIVISGRKIVTAWTRIRLFGLIVYDEH